MKKIFNRGFMLVETLVVSVFVIGVLLFMFTQFQKIRSNYELSFKYNTVNSLYAANNIRRYILSDGFDSIVANLGGNSYIDLTMCPDSYFTETNYCTNLFSGLNIYNYSGTDNINKVIFTKDDLGDLKAYLNNTPVSGFSEGMKNYILGIKTDSDTNNYRLIVEFTDNTYATLKVNGSADLYVDASLNGADPVLSSGMVPVVIDNNGVVRKANIFSKWYDYNNKQWANMVLVSSDVRGNYSNGNAIPEDKILAYFVWIPRYEYETITSSTAVEIKVNFISKEKTVPTSNYIIHPAFNFDNKELNGLWVGKFETTGSAATPTIKPNISSLINQNVVTQFSTSLKFGNRTLNSDGSITNNADKSTYGLNYESRMIKNTEWGVVAYLSRSKYGINDEIRLNNNSTPKTGCGASVSNANNTSSCEIEYGKVTSYPQSTTGNITGIFDMSGGGNEDVMGAQYNSASNTNLGIASSGFTQSQLDALDAKYINKYNYGTTYADAAAYNRAITGDATKETKNWYNDTSYFLYNTSSWFHRGGSDSDGLFAGAYDFSMGSGQALGNVSFRTVISGS